MLDKSIYSLVTQGLTGREHIRVAVIGTKGSGKTVFLTALTNHLRNHDKKRLDLKGWSVTNLECDGGNTGGMPSFQYAKAREQLSRGEWPDNTRSLSVVRLKLRLEKTVGKKTKRRTVILELLDLPGERVADLSMVGRSFREWCEWMEDRFCGVEGISPYYSEYVQRIESENDRDAILSAYKDCVSKQFEKWILTITPSVLKLDMNGEFKYKDGEPLSAYRKNIESTCIGVDEDSQFAPLPRSYFNGKSSEQRAIVKAFKKAYGKYRSRIVNPISEWLFHVNKAVYLVDVLSLLRNGPEQYNAEQSFAGQALRMFRRTYSDSPLLKGVQRFMGALVRTHADGVYVVATKADTAVGEANRSRMKELANRMLKPALSDLGLPANQMEVLSCASVKTSENHDKERALTARVKDDDGKSVVETTYEVHDVPMDWPEEDEWNSCREDYDFRPTFPKFDKKLDRPPSQLGLESLVMRLLSLQ
ncbi:MAG: YcjX family protein [Kiritimatiellae bacterium]|nr:YcjX family protein [Kiritimatiellia bacterium]MBQ3344421.1 YcjX family protein [Kiritimatiellia bacterium]MBQ6327420.1 YcjX family protein [Kiritimatiellia bacterium]